MSHQTFLCFEQAKNPITRPTFSGAFAAVLVEVLVCIFSTVLTATSNTLNLPRLDIWEKETALY